MKKKLYLCAIIRKVMKHVLLSFVFLLIGITAVAGDVKHIRITYDYISVNPSESADQAERNAILCAQKQALEEHFGLDVVGMTSMLQSERVEKDDVAYSESFLHLNEVSVRGEWIETIAENVLATNYENGYWHVRVYVEGRARNYSTDKPEIQYSFINNAHDRQNRKEYYDGDDIFLRFSSPVSGALCVYLVDAEQNAYCLLPYRSSTKGYQPIQANVDYLFFYKDKANPQADEYILNTQYGTEQNALYVIFSPNTFTKAADQRAGKNWRDEQLPRQLSYADLIKWLAKNQTRDENMVVRREIVSIKK